MFDKMSDGLNFLQQVDTLCSCKRHNALTAERYKYTLPHATVGLLEHISAHPILAA